MKSPLEIRLATAGELPRLQKIEVAAGGMFATVGMEEIANDVPPSIDQLESYRAAGLAWVAAGEEVAGYLIAELVDDALHIEQVTVHPDYAGRGIGRSLIEYGADDATKSGRAALTLTTFENVPWNAPYYRRLGFGVIADEMITPGLQKIRDHERVIGLDKWPRVAMRKELPSS